MHKLGKVPNLCAQIFKLPKIATWHFLANFGTFEFCALKLGNVLNLYAQIRQGAKFVRAKLQVAKNSYNFGTFWVILALFNFVRSN